MKAFFKKVWAFVVRSSADPRSTSLALKGALAYAVTYYTANIVPPLTLVCEPMRACGLVDPTFLMTLNNLIELIGNLIFFLLSTVAIAITIFGLLRKLTLTFKGKNLALHD